MSGYSLLNGDLFEGLAAGLGIFEIKHIRHAKTDNQSLLKILETHGGPIPFVCCSEEPGFYQRGVARISKSAAQHAGLFVGSRQAEQIRKNHPDLLKPRFIPGTVPRADGYNWQLEPVPQKIEPYEIIESQIKIACNSMENAVRKGEQAVAFVRDWTEKEADAILYAAYYFYGNPYDVAEIGKYIWSFFPNPKALKVCSSFVATSLMGQNPKIINSLELGDKDIAKWLLFNNSDPEKCTPGDLGRYLFSNNQYQPIAFNCVLSDAKNKI